MVVVLLPRTLLMAGVRSEDREIWAGEKPVAIVKAVTSVFL